MLLFLFWCCWPQHTKSAHQSSFTDHWLVLSCDLIWQSAMSIFTHWAPGSFESCSTLIVAGGDIYLVNVGTRIWGWWATVQIVNDLNMGSVNLMPLMALRTRPKLLAVNRIFLYCNHRQLFLCPEVRSTMVLRSSSDGVIATDSSAIQYPSDFLMESKVSRWVGWDAAAGSGDKTHHWPVNLPRADSRWSR